MWLAWIPSLSIRIDREARDIVCARSASPTKTLVSSQALAAEHLASFYSTLGDAGRADQIVMDLFKAAADAGVNLDKGEYKPAHDRAGRFDTYSIVLPVRGDYGSIRRFCESVLLTTPYAALDDIRFERTSASESTVKATLRFTMFVRAQAQATSEQIATSEAVR